MFKVQTAEDVSKYGLLVPKRRRSAGLLFSKGPRTQIMGFQGPNTIPSMVFGP